MVINETEKKYDVDIEFSNFDKQGYLTPVGYQNIANTVADKHLINYEMSFEKLFSKGISWVILSMSIDIINPIKGRDDKLIAKTWYSSRKGIFHRREICVEKEDGTPMFNCATYSTLLNLSTRSIFKSRTLPFELMEPTEKLLLDAKPTFKEKHEFEKGENRLVRRSYIDAIGHVNNAKYSSFCVDAFNDEEADMQKMKRMEIYFVSELTMGQKFTTNKKTDDNRLIVQGFNEDEQKTAFYGVFTY